ncbi:hypothetical protein BDM02DRAFT_1359129 [Thelephora ganbajun]|uniref:Uncharacterized protein n=1 Tax=Thelephora ganbajun TaxID=370292 RepID=A0ACB6Z3K9_THEGA|nr:hypothetical protein BDM02DRAFT_1359129 [Thelephora ganbajun]
MNKPVVPIPYSSCSSNPGLGTSSAADYTTSTWGGPPREALRGPPNPSARAIYRDRQPLLGGTPTSSAPSRARVDVPEYAEPSYSRSLGHGGVGNQERLVAVPPDPYSGGIFSQPTGIQRSRTGREARQTAAQDRAGPGRKPTTKRKPDDSQVSTERIPKTSVITCDPTYLARVPQTRYICAVGQGDWEGVSIEFGGIKLKDVANPACTSLQDHDEEVLNYEGAGSTISCRINVRSVCQSSTPDTLSHPSSFSSLGAILERRRSRR